MRRANLHTSQLQCANESPPSSSVSKREPSGDRMQPCAQIAASRFSASVARGRLQRCSIKRWDASHSGPHRQGVKSASEPSTAFAHCKSLPGSTSPRLTTYFYPAYRAFAGCMMDVPDYQSESGYQVHRDYSLSYCAKVGLRHTYPDRETENLMSLCLRRSQRLAGTLGGRIDAYSNVAKLYSVFAAFCEPLAVSRARLCTFLAGFLTPPTIPTSTRSQSSHLH